MGDSDPNLIGYLLDGRYQILSLLGRGGMGDVYVAMETRLRRKVAVKVLHRALAREPGHVERFLREAQTIAQLQHPNIVDIFGYGEKPAGLVFFVMELLAGEDLETRLRARQERPLGVYEACLWAIQIARAVGVVHEAGLIHRDLKPSNVFLAERKDGELAVKLLDFGIARPEAGSDLTGTGVALGTPNYMSPEQIHNAAIDRRADIYSFGVLLFKLLTGRLPFAGDALQVAMQHCDVPPPSPRAAAPEAGISAALEEVVLNCMAKRPDDRYQSMRAVEAALTAILEDEAPELAPRGVPVRMRTYPPAERLRAAAPPEVAPVAATEVAAGGKPSGQTTAIEQPANLGGLYLLTAGSAISFVVVVVVLLLRCHDTGVEPASAPRPAGSATPATGQPSVAAPSPAPKRPATGEPAREGTPEARPVTPPQPTPAAVEEPVKSRDAGKTAPSRRSAVIQQIEARARACRRKLDAIGGPKLPIDYSVGSDGKVIRATAPTASELGKCLEQAVRQAQFEPGLALAQKIAL